MEEFKKFLDRHFDFSFKATLAVLVLIPFIIIHFRNKESSCQMQEDEIAQKFRYLKEYGDPVSKIKLVPKPYIKANLIEDEVTLTDPLVINRILWLIKDREVKNELGRGFPEWEITLTLFLKNGDQLLIDVHGQYLQLNRPEIHKYHKV